MLSSTFLLSGTRRKPAHWTNAFWPQLVDLFQLVPAGKGPVFSRYLTMFFETAALRPEMRSSREGRRCSDPRLPGSRSPPPRRPRLHPAVFGHVVLILPHADGLGIDFYQLRQRVLKPAGDGDGARRVRSN